MRPGLGHWECCFRGAGMQGNKNDKGSQVGSGWLVGQNSLSSRSVGLKGSCVSMLTRHRQRCGMPMGSWRTRWPGYRSFTAEPNSDKAQKRSCSPSTPVFALVHSALALALMMRRKRSSAAEYTVLQENKKKSIGIFPSSTVGCLESQITARYIVYR
ncbi:hypothetical protein KIL84_003942 [Mauremys mutica]|uniref:Uncharacterized protein n=1 Tax=Mauremys mutica TaxID=74926 RepID=A0A9D3WQF4_9SAUR|nr:hypothetical protein KIL84_003942 [Mauremys mutica]